MKWTFILLLLGNVLYLGWEMDRETRLQIKHQLSHAAIPAEAERLKLLSELPGKPRLKDVEDRLNAVMTKNNPATSPEDVPDNRTVPSEDFYATMPEPVNVDDDSLLMELIKGAEIETSDDSQSIEICFSYGPFAREADLETLRNWFYEWQHPVRQRVEYEQDKELFWVYLAPRTDRAQAVTTLSELKDQGVKDYRLIQKGSFRNAISLGLFSSQAGVNRRLSELNAKGYKPVVIPYHDIQATRIYWLDVVMETNTRLTSEALTGFPARYNSLPRDCDEIAMIENSP